MRWRDLIKLPNFKVFKPITEDTAKKEGSKSEKKSWHGYGLCWGRPKRRKA